MVVVNEYLYIVTVIINFDWNGKGVVIMDKYDIVLEKIAHYRAKKENNIFDDFYNADLDLMEECITLYKSLLIKECIHKDILNCKNCSDNKFCICAEKIMWGE
jgi:hypothetical protein